MMEVNYLFHQEDQMLQKIKLSEDDYVFEFCYVDEYELLPFLSIRIAEDIISRHIINDGVFTFEKNSQNIDIFPRYTNKKYTPVDRNKLYSVKNYIDKNHTWTNAERTHLCLIKSGFPILYFTYDDGIYTKERSIFNKIKSFFKL